MRHYYVRCIADYCAAASAAEESDDVTVAMETDAAVCQTLDAYSELCVSRQTMFTWRTASLCRMSSVPHHHHHHYSWMGGSVVERRSLTGELSLVCTGPAADG